MSSGDVGVIVLAAGVGRRLGLGPKAHVELGGETFLARVVRCCRQAGLDAILVVGGPRDPAIAEACASLGVELTINTEPELGMSSSVEVALRAVGGDWRSGAIVFPVDVPLVEASTVASLARAVRVAGAEAWVRPVHDGRRGHPIALGAALSPRLLALGAGVPLRDALVAAGARSVDVPCPDRGVTMDVDTPEDLEAARAAVAWADAR